VTQRPVTLVTGPWLDLPLAQLAAKAAEWGYQGLELTCGGDHFDLTKAAQDEQYCQALLGLLSEHDLRVWTVHQDMAGLRACQRQQSRLPRADPENPDDPLATLQYAAQQVQDLAQAAHGLGVRTVVGVTGSPVWQQVLEMGPVPEQKIHDGYRLFAEVWNPVLDFLAERGMRFAVHVSPGQIAFDLYSAEAALEALQGREEFGLAFDPSHLYWQGVDPAAFLRQFRERIYHVFLRDASVALDGRSGILGSLLPWGDRRRGWEFRSPGRGGVDWEAVVRALNDIGYTGPLAVLWDDPGMDRDFGAAEACQFVRRLDFPAPGDRADPSQPI
jgi:sugar phosphate isomerase/epimerase